VVSLRLLSLPGMHVIEVVDNGPGIAPAERERVFDAFYRLPGAAVQGNGIGLAIAREAAARMGGAVSLDQPGHGQGLVFRYRQAAAG
jgi:signal transduction histidine kinase